MANLETRVARLEAATGSRNEPAVLIITFAGSPRKELQGFHIWNGPTIKRASDESEDSLRKRALAAAREVGGGLLLEDRGDLMLRGRSLAKETYTPEQAYMRMLHG